MIVIVCKICTVSVTVKLVLCSVTQLIVLFIMLGGECKGMCKMITNYF